MFKVRKETNMKTMKQALKEAGLTAKTVRWPRKKGPGTITVTITTDRVFKPGTGFALSFVEVNKNK